MITIEFKITLEPKGSNAITEEGIDIAAHELLRRLNETIKPNIITANPGAFVEVAEIQKA